MELIFQSKKFPGYIMNRYGTVLFKSQRVEDPVKRDAVCREAREAGWVKVFLDCDVGYVYKSP